MLKPIISGALAATLGVWAMAANAADELVISTATPPQHVQTLTMTSFANALQERSNGALKTKVFDSSQLYNARDVGKAVARGDVGMATVPSPYLSRVEANINVLDLPMLKGLTAEERAAMLDGPVGDTLNKMLNAKMGVVVPGHWPILGRVYYWSTKKPLTNFEEFVGMQVRIPGGAGPAALVEGMGGVPVVMPGSDMPLALQQGTVDATMASIESVVQQKLTDVGIRYGFWDKGIVGFLIPIVSQGYWDSLTADEQALFSEVWGRRGHARANDAATASGHRQVQAGRGPGRAGGRRRQVSRAIAVLDRLIGWITAAALGITFVLLVYNVATRYLIQFGIVPPSVQLNWVFEICVFLLVWAVLLGVARIEKRAQHIRVDFLYNTFGPLAQKAAEVFALVFAIAVAVFFIYSGKLVVDDAILWDERSETTLRTPFWILYLALSVSFTVHLLFIVERLRLLISTGESAKQKPMGEDLPR